LKRKIVTKYPGFCRVCKRAIDEGKEVYFEKGKGVWHLDCDSPEVNVVPKKYLYATIFVIIILLVILVGALSTSRPSSLVVSTVTATQALTETVYLTSVEESTSALITSESVGGKWLGSDENVIVYLDAEKYVGQRKTVEGTIVRTYNSGKAIFLNFHDPYQGYFYAVIFKDDWGAFSFKPEDYYRGKEVRVTGRARARWTDSAAIP